MPATVVVKWFAGLDDSSPSFRNEVLQMLDAARQTEQLYWFRADTNADSEAGQESGFKAGIRIRFSNSDAAYYQFSLFPPHDLEYVSGWARKRDGDSQVLLLTLRSRECLNDFIEVCRGNPHVVGIESITEEEFASAPSNAV